MEFEGKAALITGSAGGIGRAAAALFAAGGAKVVLVDTNSAGLNETASLIKGAGGEAIPLTADITKPEDMERAVKEVVTNSAG